MTKLLALVPLFWLSACSPVYVYKAAAGHGKLLWRRKSIAKAVADPKTAPDFKAKLELVLAIREFGFRKMHLARSSNYTSYSIVEGPALTYLVSGSEKTRLKPYYWSFPLIGSFPYKGYFDRKDAEAEKRRLEERGYDATIGGSAAYNTGLWFADPVPSLVLDYPPGELAALILHELTHGTVFFKSQTEFDEALATFVGDQGAAQFLAERFGADSPELAEFRRSREADKALTARFAEIRARLDELYGGKESRDEKLKRREELFVWGKERLKELGHDFAVLDNAVVLAHRLYHDDQSRFQAAYDSNGRDWARAIDFFRSLDRLDPAGDLRRRLER